MTIWNTIKENWSIKKKRIQEMGIDPQKESGEITFKEMCLLAEELEVTVSEFVEYYTY